VGEEGAGETAVELLAAGKVALVVNTPRGLGSRADGAYIRTAAAAHRVPCLTTVAAALAAAEGVADWADNPMQVCSLQEWLSNPPEYGSMGGQSPPMKLPTLPPGSDAR
jgi:carbamoyl-phosphate synthase large subunit